MDIGNLLFNTEGEITRRDWWFGQVCVIVIALVLGFLFHFSIPTELTLHIFSIHNISIGMVIGITCFWMHLVLNMKRWRDIGKSGWWTILNYIPILGAFVSIFILGFVKSHAEKS